MLSLHHNCRDSIFSMMENKPLSEKERMMEKELEKAGMPLLRAEAEPAFASLSQMICPSCGSVNDSNALFCEQCGARLRDEKCPFCGAPLESHSDYCERCHRYVDTEHCSFCHALVGEEDAFCPECGASLSGMECPVCHTVGRFGFCSACGTPLTDSARLALKEAWQDEALVQEVTKLEQELEHLWMTTPIGNEQQRAKRLAIADLNQRVKDLLAMEHNRADGDIHTAEMPVAPSVTTEPEQLMTEEELQQKIDETKAALQQILDSMATPAQTNPAFARNTAMARKPHVSRLAWKCNYKQALHSSPLGCACPQHGGKWVVLDGRIVDDN